MPFDHRCFCADYYLSHPIHFFLFSCVFFFFNDTATPEISTLSLHDALPICAGQAPLHEPHPREEVPETQADRKSTRLNSSHLVISYAVFCLKKILTPHSCFRSASPSSPGWSSAAAPRPS